MALDTNPEEPTFGDGRYYDSLTVDVKLVPYIDEPASDILSLELHGVVVDAEAARDLLEASANAEGWVAHDLEFREHRFSWGASGSGAQIVLLVSQGVVGNAAYEALKAALRSVALEARKRLTRPISPNPLTADEATARARWLVEQRYDVAASSLTVTAIAETFDPRAFEVRLEEKPIAYTVTIEDSDGLAVFSRIAMSRSDA
jgi:hypothetical protein